MVLQTGEVVEANVPSAAIVGVVPCENIEKWAYGRP